MNADIEAEGVEHGKYGEVNAFESAGERLPAAFLGVSVFVMTKEA